MLASMLCQIPLERITICNISSEERHVLRIHYISTCQQTDEHPAQDMSCIPYRKDSMPSHSKSLSVPLWVLLGKEIEC